jgi:thioredoxin reductase (NADPH)
VTGAAARTPVILIVDPDLQASMVLKTALARRFGPDYRVLTAGSADEALQALEDLAHDHADVALVAAELHLERVDGVDFLQRAH